MPQLSKQMERWLARYNQRVNVLQEGGFKSTPTNAREGMADLTRALVTQRPKISWVQDDLIPGEVFDVPVRIYHPEPDSELPVLVYFHGGGHMAGSVTVYDPICRKIAVGCRHIVVSVDYRLAPECPYPAAVQDAKHVVRGLWTLLDGRKLNHQRRLCIAGDSGGGALCATVAHQVQDQSSDKITRQVLIYPSLDYTLSSDSVVQNSTGYLLETEKIEWYFDNYFQNREDRRAASPLYMSTSGHLPETLVITAEFCPLRDEGIAYVQKLLLAGIACQHLHLDDMIHAFLNMEDIAGDACQAAYRHMAQFLNNAAK